MHNSLHNRLHGAVDLSFLLTTWMRLHSLPQAELRLKKLLPGDNLINQLSVISTLNHWCRRQIAFLSSSLGGGWWKKIGGVCLITQMLLYSAPAFPASKVINVCVAKCARVVRSCLRLISGPSYSGLSVYSFVKPNHPTCCKPQSAVSVHTPADLKSKAEHGAAVPFCCRSVMSVYWK